MTMAYRQVLHPTRSRSAVHFGLQARVATSLIGRLCRRCSVLMGAGFVGFALTMARTAKYGVGTSSDSAVYVFAAKSLAERHAYVTYDGGPLVDFPPLFSLILALCSRFSGDYLLVARFINATCFGFIIVLSGLWLRNHVESRALRGVGLATVIVAVPLRIVTSYAWSEPLFLVFVLTFLLSIERFLIGGRTKWLLFSATAVALACMTRYIGMSIIVGAAGLLLMQKGSHLRRGKNALLFGIVSSLPLVLWIARNYVRSSTFFGYRSASSVALRDNVHATADLVTWAIIPIDVPQRLGVFALILAVIFAAAVFRPYRERATLPADHVRGATSITYITIAYLAYLLVSATAVAIDRIDLRLLSPIHLLIILLSLQALDRVWHVIVRGRCERLVRGTFIGALCFALSFSLVFTMKDLVVSAQRGAGGHATTQWHESPTIAYLHSHPLSGTIYSNDPHGLFLLTGLTVFESPRKYSYNSPTDTKADNSARFIQAAKADDGVYLVWINNDYASFFSFLYSPEAIGHLVHLEAVATTTDGTIYHVTAAHPDG